MQGSFKRQRHRIRVRKRKHVTTEAEGVKSDCVMHAYELRNVGGRSVVAQSLSRVRLLETCGLQHARLPCPSLFLRVCSLTSIESMIPSNHLILRLLLLLLPSIFPSIRVFSNKSALRIRWPKYWSFSFSISPSNEYSGMISFRMDWLDLLAVQGTCKSLPQHRSSKTSVLQRSAL